MAVDFSRHFDEMFFFDLEASGLVKSGTQYPQIYDAGYVKTDSDLNIIEEGNIIIKPRIDIIPTPMAFAITRLDIDKLERMGVPEYSGIKQLQQKMMERPNTLITGYNTMTYDDEVNRHTLYRNLKNPYSHEWQNGNARMDLYGLIQMVYAFSPSIMKWPLNDEGNVSLKLENLSKENGLSHEKAHDAMSDVKATIGLAKIIKDGNPSLWNYFLWLTKKDNALSVLTENDMVFQTSPFFGKECRMTRPVHPLIMDRKVKTTRYCIDLTADPESIKMLTQMTPAEIAEIMFTKREDLPEGMPKLPITKVTANKGPNIVRANDSAIRARAESFGYNPDHVLENMAFIRQNPQLKRVIQEAMVSNFDKNEDPEFNMYSGFPSKRDEGTLDSLHSKDSTNPGKIRLTELPISEWSKNLDDKSKITLALRSKYGNFLPDLLLRDKAPINELKAWFVDLENRIVKGHGGAYTFKDFERELREVRQEQPLDDEQIEVLNKLESYVEKRKEQLQEIKADIRAQLKVKEQGAEPTVG